MMWCLVKKLCSFIVFNLIEWKRLLLCLMDGIMVKFLVLEMWVRLCIIV